MKNSNKCQEKYLKLSYMLYNIESVVSTTLITEIWNTSNRCKTNDIKLVCDNISVFISEDKLKGKDKFNYIDKLNADEFINVYRYFLRKSIKKDLSMYNKMILKVRKFFIY